MRKLTEDIDNLKSNPENRNVNIQNVNIPVFSSDDYIRNSFAKENVRDFVEIYNRIIDRYLAKRLGEKKPRLNSREIKNKIIFLVNTIVKLTQLIVRFYRYLLDIFYKFRKITNLFNLKKIFLKKD